MRGLVRVGPYVRICTSPGISQVRIFRKIYKTVDLIISSAFSGQEYMRKNNFVTIFYFPEENTSCFVSPWLLSFWYTCPTHSKHASFLFLYKIHLKYFLLPLYAVFYDKCLLIKELRFLWLETVASTSFTFNISQVKVERKTKFSVI